MKQPLGVILAGGLSRRMGGDDKALTLLATRPMVAHVVDRMAPQVAELAINANGDASRYAAFALPVIADTLPGHLGPLAGILAGLNWAASMGADHIVTAAADTPFLPEDLVPQLLFAAETNQAPIALAYSASGLHPTFGLWPVSLRDDLEAALKAGTRRLAGWAEEQGAAQAEFPVLRVDPFFNVNTPEDLVEAEALIAG